MLSMMQTWWILFVALIAGHFLLVCSFDLLRRQHATTASAIPCGRSCRRGTKRSSLKMEIFEGNPVGKKVWDWVWTLDLLKPGEKISATAQQLP